MLCYSAEIINEYVLLLKLQHLLSMCNKGYNKDWLSFICLPIPKCVVSTLSLFSFDHPKKMKFHVVRNGSFHDTNLSNKKRMTRDKTYLKKTPKQSFKWLWMENILRQIIFHWKSHMVRNMVLTKNTNYFTLKIPYATKW